MFLQTGCGNLFRNSQGTHKRKLTTKNKKAKKTKDTFRDLEKKTASFIEGVILYEQGRPEEAINPLQEVLKTDENFAPAWYMLGKVSQSLKNFDKAYSYFQKAYELNSKHKWYGLAYAEILEYNREYKKALEIYEKIYRENSKDSELAIKLLEIYTRQKEYDKALQLVNKLEEVTGMERNAGELRIRLLLRKGNITDAIAEARRLSRKFPDEITWKQHLYNIYSLIGEEDSTVNALHQILELKPDDFFALHQLFQYEFSKKNYPEARKYLFRLLNSPLIEDNKKIKLLQDIYSTTTSEIREKLGVTEFVQNLENKEKIAPKFAIFLGDIHFSQGNNEKALHYYKKALYQNSDNTLLWEQILSLEEQLGYQDSVIKHALEALEIFPEQIIFNYYLASAYIRKKEYKEAEYYLRKIEKVGSSDNTLMLEVYMMLGEVYHRSGEYKKSDTYFEKALQIAPASPTVLNNYAYFSTLHGGDLKKAEEMMEKVIKDYPNVPAYSDTYGWILYKKGNYSEALQWIKKAYKNSLDPDPEIIEHLGDVYEKLGDTSQAIKYWQEAYEKTKDKKIYEKIRKHSAR